MYLETIIEHFAMLDPALWKQLAMKASWHYRTHGDLPMPPAVVAAIGGDTIPRGDWDKVRAGVSKRRKAIQQATRAEEWQQRRARRNRYMKEYMRDVRAQRKAG